MPKRWLTGLNHSKQCRNGFVDAMSPKLKLGIMPFLESLNAPVIHILEHTCFPTQRLLRLLNLLQLPGLEGSDRGSPGRPRESRYVPPFCDALLQCFRPFGIDLPGVADVSDDSSSTNQCPQTSIVTACRASRLLFKPSRCSDIP
jgi:hypothetical protein